MKINFQAAGKKILLFLPSNFGHKQSSVLG